MFMGITLEVGSHKSHGGNSRTFWVVTIVHLLIRASYLWQECDCHDVACVKEKVAYISSFIRSQYLGRSDNQKEMEMMKIRPIAKHISNDCRCKVVFDE